jgi:flagellar biogenesis protein FliO
VTRRLHIGIVLAILLAVTTPGWAQPKTPASASSDEALEYSPIASDNSTAASPRSDQPGGSSRSFDVTRVGVALVGVIGLILILRLFARRVIPGAAVHRSTSSVKILGRCPVSARQNLLVVQFGNRLVLVGDAGASLNPLCEITDPNEVAGIVAHARDESISVARRFESLFGRARKDFTEDAESFDDSRDIKPDDPSLRDTQQELSELREKVRDVARQIGSA